MLPPRRKACGWGASFPLGYEVINRELCIREDEAQSVRQLFDLYLELGTVKAIKKKVDSLGMTSRPKASKEASLFGRGHIYGILINPIYIGKIPHKKLIHEGLHKAIVNLGKMEQGPNHVAGQCGTRA